MKKRAMKKWIPRDTCYCGGCKWRKYIRTDLMCKSEYKNNVMNNIRQLDKGDKIIECNHTDCKEECWTDPSSSCRAIVYRCDYLNYTDLEQNSLLWDGCKECEIE